MSAEIAPGNAWTISESPDMRPSDAAGEGRIIQGTNNQVELSVVIPCLNESETLAKCISKASWALDKYSIKGEVIVADNGSTDGSHQIALALGAQVVHVGPRGYGNALKAGIAAAHGKYVVIGDADDSYDFREIARFLDVLRGGADLVQGCRLSSGGGKVLPGAMPWLHRWIGNPLLSWLARVWFGSSIHDVYCGLRGFSKEAYLRLDQRSTGMEFATEMIIKASLLKLQLAEVPITLHPDGRTVRRPHLRTFRDGWRTLRFFLLYCPRWLFLVPGFTFVMLGALGIALALPGFTVGRLTFDAHSLLVSCLSVLCGHQCILFWVYTRTFGEGAGLLPPDPTLRRLVKMVTLERGVLIGTAALVIGVVLIVAAANQWRMTDFGRLDYSQTMRWVIPGATLVSFGIQTVFASFFISVLDLQRR